MKILIPLLLVVSATAAAAVTTTHNFPVGLPVPDNTIIGLADSREITNAGGPVQHLTVSLELSGGWNGDLYAYLVHDTGFAVLLNRIGRSPANTVGSGTSGLQIVLDDSAAFDIHLGLPASGSIAGAWQPDARPADPDLVTEASPRRAFLGSFSGLNPNGRWTLFMADLSPGGTSTLNNWSLNITSVPEPASALLVSLLPAWFFLSRRRPQAILISSDRW